MRTVRRALTWRELALFVAVLVAGVGVLLTLGGSVLWTRPLWFDELCCTVYPASYASPSAVTAAVLRGEDYAPPLLHLIVWSVGRVTGSITPVLLRSISFACASLGLLLLYVTLRRRFGRFPSGAGTLAVASHSLVIAHAFEGRFYGPWLLFATAFSWSLSIDLHRRQSLRRDLAVAGCSILLVTIHWFGVLSLALMVAAGFAAHGRRWLDGLRHVAPAAAGFVVLLALLPAALGQRASATGGDVLWIANLSGAQIMSHVRLYFLAAVPTLAMILLLRDGVRSRGAWPSIARSGAAAIRDPGIASLFSLALMPVVLAIVSLTLQPSMLERYSVLAVLAWAPLVALAVASIPAAGRVAVAGFIAVPLWVGFSKAIAQKREFAQAVAANAAAFHQAAAMHVPVVFHSMQVLYEVAAPRRSDNPLARFLDLPDSTIASLYPSERLEWLRRFFRLERNMMRSHAAVYGFPRLATQAQLDSTPRFLLLATDLRVRGGERQSETWGGVVFPRHRVTRVNDRLSLFELQEYSP